MNNPWQSSDFDAVRKAARAIADLHQQAAIDTEILINRLIDSGSEDVDVIQRLLDQSLDACAHKAAISAFERLCRYYAEIDIVGARFYSDAYLEMWGDPKANQSEVSDDT
jgi:hypothetical protein